MSRDLHSLKRYIKQGMSPSKYVNQIKWVFQDEHNLRDEKDIKKIILLKESLI